MSLRRSVCSRKALQTVEKTFCRCYSDHDVKIKLNTCTKYTNSDIRLKRTTLFKNENERQLSTLKRIEKIEVKYKGQFEPCTLVMNKGLSTPHHCAMHINELTIERSVLALVNGEPWDMHRPLMEDCEIQFLHFLEENPEHVNEAFWKSCSFLLGYVMERAFKDNFLVHNCTFPRPIITSGSFTYDVDLRSLPGSWKPSETELRTMSKVIGDLQKGEERFQRLDIEVPVAREMFNDNNYKTSQIPAIAAKSKSGFTVPVYRIGDHVDISTGPLIPSASFINYFKIAALHKIQHKDYGSLTRVQGVALPRDLKLHYFAFEALCNRAKNLNTSWEDLDDHFQKFQSQQAERADTKSRWNASMGQTQERTADKENLHDIPNESQRERISLSWS